MIHFITNEIHLMNICISQIFYIPQRDQIERKIKMSEFNGFYEGLIYATADNVREKHGVYKLPSVKENRYRKAGIYVDTVEKILEVFKEDEDKYWDLKSLKQKLNAIGGKKKDFPASYFPNETLDDSEFYSVISCLEESRHIEPFEKENTYGSGTSVYYKLPSNYWRTRHDSWPYKIRRGFFEILPLLTLTFGISLIHDTFKKK